MIDGTEILPKETTLFCICEKLTFWNSYFQKYQCHTCHKSMTLKEAEAVQIALKVKNDWK